jgi:hypothetical protein
MVFAATAASDSLWTLYIRAVSAKEVFGAGVVSALIVLLGAYAIIEYVRDRRAIFAAAAGAFVGTVLTMLV